jgi:ABC-2 type transport system ATP-binding protein
MGHFVAQVAFAPVSAVAVESLVVRFGEHPAVDGVSFAAEAGTVTAVLGPNGAGKTTTLETLEGYRRPTSGTVRVLGHDPVGDRHEIVGRIGVMLQRGGVYSTLGPEAVVRLFAGYYERPLAVDDLLDRLGLRGCATTPWRHLSGGEQQRVSLALALVGRPEVAFLDEPSAGLDPRAREELWQVVRELRADGACILVTTHQHEEAERLADRIVILDQGRVVADASPAELAAGGGDEIRFSAVEGLDLAALSLAVGDATGLATEVTPGEYVVAVAASPANVAAITSWLAAQQVTVGDLRAGRQRLQDVFDRLVGQPSQAELDRAPRTRRRRGGR